jgi:hypothetical protein
MRLTMYRTRSRLGLLSITLVLTGAGTACDDADPDTGSAQHHQAATNAPATNSPKVDHVSGYPLDRSLAGLVGMRDVDTIVTVTSAEPSQPQYVGSIGPDGDQKAPAFIVTPVGTTIDAVYRGTPRGGDTITLIIGGGTVGKNQVIASTEIAPQLDDVVKYTRLIVAGKMIKVDGLGQVLDPWFVYGVDDAGRATSLMESAGGGDVSFTLEEFQRALSAG